MPNITVHKRTFVNPFHMHQPEEITAVSVEWWEPPNGHHAQGMWLVRVWWKETRVRADHIGWLFEGTIAYDDAMTMFEAAHRGMLLDGPWYQELTRVAL